MEERLAPGRINFTIAGLGGAMGLPFLIFDAFRDAWPVSFQGMLMSNQDPTLPNHLNRPFFPHV